MLQAFTQLSGTHHQLKLASGNVKRNKQLVTITLNIHTHTQTSETNAHNIKDQWQQKRSPKKSTFSHGSSYHVQTIQIRLKVNTTKGSTSCIHVFTLNRANPAAVSKSTNMTLSAISPQYFVIEKLVNKYQLQRK